MSFNIVAIDFKKGAIFGSVGSLDRALLTLKQNLTVKTCLGSFVKDSRGKFIKGTVKIVDSMTHYIPEQAKDENHFNYLIRGALNVYEMIRVRGFDFNDLVQE